MALLEPTRVRVQHDSRHILQVIRGNSIETIEEMKDDEGY